LVKNQKQDNKLKNKLKINYLLSLFVIKGVNELVVLFNNTFRLYFKKHKKKASHTWGRVMGNLIFNPIP